VESFKPPYQLPLSKKKLWNEETINIPILQKFLSDEGKLDKIDLLEIIKRA
jgi:hypothetical protein